MQQSELPLYPKISSIYNKIMQIALAIVFIIVLMNLWLSTSNTDRKIIDQHFTTVSKEYLKQIGVGIEILLKNNHQDALKTYIDELSLLPFVQTAHLYDASGKVLFSSSSNSVNYNTMNDLYGISADKINQSSDYVPFVQEVRDEKLLGYLRVTIEKSYLNDTLSDGSEDRQKLLRLMLIIAGAVGFLLTRGLNRFSRQGYRPPQDK